MPKVRKSSVLAVEFEVSPWQSKKRRHDEVQGKSAARPESITESRQGHDEGPGTYAVQPQHVSQHAEPQQPSHIVQNGRKLEIAEVHQPDNESADIDSSLGILNFMEGTSEVSPEIRAAMQRILQPAQASELAAPASSSPQLPNKLEGAACLAWLPDGRLIGDLHSLDANTAVSIRGREVVSERECTRDAEWKLLHVTLQRFSSCQRVSFLAEKTGCDAAMLNAPFQLHGSEAGLLREATLQSDPSIHLSFACEELLSDEAAERKLAAGRPELCGQGAIVNVGSFTCSGSGLECLDHPHAGQHELYDSDLDR